MGNTIHCCLKEGKQDEYQSISNSLQQSYVNTNINGHYKSNSFSNYQEQNDKILQYNEEKLGKTFIEKNIDLVIENYTKILKPLAIQVKNILCMSSDKKFEKTHNYINSLAEAQQYSSNNRKINRIQKEIKQLYNNLPVYPSNSIFVAYDNRRLDVMKAVIIGAEDTPYANGIFVFDILLEENYPLTPPKVNLMTTGGGNLRFNPNLYETGYVCLSLLGTWRGNATENWSPATSSIYQVLMSIQSIVMSEDVYFNEPFRENERGTVRGKELNIGYSNIVRYGTVCLAMKEMIRNPPKEFEDIVRIHFFMKKQVIINTVQQWLEAAKNDKPSYYEGLVESHNWRYTQQFTNQGNYYKMLKKEFEQLVIALESIQISEIQQRISKYMQSSSSETNESQSSPKNNNNDAADQNVNQNNIDLQVVEKKESNQLNKSLLDKEESKNNQAVQENHSNE